MFERFTNRARRVISLAQEEARMLNHNYIGTEHILLAIIRESEGVGAKALESLGISLDATRERVDEVISRGNKPQQMIVRGDSDCPGISRSRHAPRSHWSLHCGKRCSSATTTSAPSTSCWA